MDRSPYRQRLKKQIWRDFKESAKPRIISLVFTITGIAVTLIVGILWTHSPTAKEKAVVALISGVVASLIWLFGVLIVAVSRAPWVLDAECGKQIDALENRAIEAEKKIDEFSVTARERVELHRLFGELMDEGESLADELRRGISNFGPWLKKREDWVTRVSKELSERGLPTEAASFRQAGEKELKASPGTVLNDRLLQDLYSDQLRGYRDKLGEIVARRFP